MAAISKCRIILVDDCGDDIDLLRIVIDREQISVEVSSFQDAVDAFHFLKSLPTDKQQSNLVILDLNMPKMTGKEILNNLDENSKRNVGRFIILSGSENSADKRDCLASGAKAYYIKPWDLTSYRQFVKGPLLDEIQKTPAS